MCLGLGLCVVGVLGRAGEKQWELAASMYAKTKRSFEEITLKFITLNEKDALKRCANSSATFVLSSPQSCPVSRSSPHVFPQFEPTTVRDACCRRRMLCELRERSLVRVVPGDEDGTQVLERQAGQHARNRQGAAHYDLHVSPLNLFGVLGYLGPTALCFLARFTRLASGISWSVADW